MISDRLPIFLDIETNGLNPDIIWIAVTKQGEQILKHYDAETLREALDNDAPVVGHNMIGFDAPVIKKVWDIDIDKSRLIDTLVLSRLENPQRDRGHNLANWGSILGFPKGDHNDWSKLSPEMEEYCVRDVEVTEQAFHYLMTELEDFSEESIKLEHEVQHIINQQIKYGWMLDIKKTHNLLALLKERKYDLEETLRKRFLPLPTFVEEVEPKRKKDGSLSKVGLKPFGEHWTDVAGTFSRIEYSCFNPGSRQQIGQRLKMCGWKPRKFTDTGQPMVDESVLSQIENIPEAKLISEYLLVQKRMAQVYSWIDAVDEEDGRVHGYVNSNGAVTSRMTHSKPNLAQVPASYSPYGQECRECWAVPYGKSLVGFDASGLELRMLAHYMGDKEYTNEILNGDIHTANQKLAGLERRDQAKTFIYALLYGAGDGKLGTVVGGDAKDGAELRQRFMSNLPAFAALRLRVSSKARRGQLTGLDGRILHVRSEHSALNTLLQGAGAIVMKKALVILDDYAQRWKLDYHFVGNIHDEVQTEVRQGQEDKFGRLAVSFLEAAGLHFKLRCPLTGEYSYGKSWAETH